MRKLEPWLLLIIGALIVLTAVGVFAAPRLAQRDAAPEQTAASGEAAGETETLPARVIQILEEGTVDLGDGMTQPYQRVLVRVEGGSLAGDEIEVEEGTINVINQERLFSVGDRVYLERVVGPDGDRFYISDFIRTGRLLWIGALFVGLVLLVGRGRGLRSLLGTIFSLAVIFGFVLPQIMAGRNPVLVSIVGSVALLAVSTYLVYGFTPKAHAAVSGMILSLALTGLLAWLFVGWTHLTGLSEEGAFLVYELGPAIDLSGLILGGIIIGSLGVLDDICIGQASATFELVNANPDLRWRELLRRGLNIGRDHIAAMVNTLLLAYVGASMPLMLAFMIYQEPIWRRINREQIAEEIVRTLVGSMGLVLAVPLTGLIASLLAHWIVRREQARLAGESGLGS